MPEVIEIVDETAVVEISSDSPVVDVIVGGLQGPPGPPGSGGDAAFVFDQGPASDTWDIVHNLGKFPSVTPVDTSGSVVDGDVDYIDSDHLIVSFNAPFSGKAYLN